MVCYVVVWLLAMLPLQGVAATSAVFDALYDLEQSLKALALVMPEPREITQTAPEEEQHVALIDKLKQVSTDADVVHVFPKSMITAVKEASRDLHKDSQKQVLAQEYVAAAIRVWNDAYCKRGVRFYDHLNDAARERVQANQGAIEEQLKQEREATPEIKDHKYVATQIDGLVTNIKRNEIEPIVEHVLGVSAATLSASASLHAWISECPGIIWLKSLELFNEARMLVGAYQELFFSELDRVEFAIFKTDPFTLQHYANMRGALKAASGAFSREKSYFTELGAQLLARLLRSARVGYYAKNPGDLDKSAGPHAGIYCLELFASKYGLVAQKLGNDLKILGIPTPESWRKGADETGVDSAQTIHEALKKVIDVQRLVSNTSAYDSLKGGLLGDDIGDMVRNDRAIIEKNERSMAAGAQARYTKIQSEGEKTAAKVRAQEGAALKGPSGKTWKDAARDARESSLTIEQAAERLAIYEGKIFNLNVANKNEVQKLQEEVERQYNKKAPLWHPDKWVNSPQGKKNAEKELKKLDAAHTALMTWLGDDQSKNAGDDVLQSITKNVTKAANAPEKEKKTSFAGAIAQALADRAKAGVQDAIVGAIKKQK